MISYYIHAWGGDISDNDYGRGTCINGGVVITFPGKIKE